MLQSSHPVHVLARVRARLDNESAIVEADSRTSLTVHPYLVTDTTLNDSGAHSMSRRSSVANRSPSGRKSSMGCSSLIPRTPHTPRGLLRNVLSVFPALDEAAATSERFQMHAVLPEEATQADVFSALVADVQAVLEGYRSTVLCYGVAESGKSYTLWGTASERGVTARAVDYLFAHAPQGAKVSLSFVGLDDNTCIDYLSQGELTELRNPTWKDGVDGGKQVAKTRSVSVGDAAAAWETIVWGLGRMRSDRHQLLTISVHVPRDNGAVAVGTLQLGELCLPGAEEPMSRNISTLHDVVHGLVDKNYEGSVDYAKSLLTTMLQPAFGGNSRTVVVLNVHSTLPHYNHTIATLSFGEHCSKLKNVVAARIVQGVSASLVAGDAPAEMVRQVEKYRAYAEEVEAENETLRVLVHDWEARLEDGKRRHDKALKRATEGFETRLATAEAALSELQLRLDAALLISNGQRLMLARQEAMLERVKQETDLDVTTMETGAVDLLVRQVEELEQTVASLRVYGAPVEPAAPAPASSAVAVATVTTTEAVSSNNNVPAAQTGDVRKITLELRRVQAENMALKKAAAEQAQLVTDLDAGDGDATTQLSRYRAALRTARQEIADLHEEASIKETEMRDREELIEEKDAKIKHLHEQLLLVKILKASAKNFHSSNSSFGSGTVGARKDEVLNKAKSRAKAMAKRQHAPPPQQRSMAGPRRYADEHEDDDDDERDVSEEVERAPARHRTAAPKQSKKSAPLPKKRPAVQRDESDDDDASGHREESSEPTPSPVKVKKPKTKKAPTRAPKVVETVEVRKAAAPKAPVPKTAPVAKPSAPKARAVAPKSAAPKPVRVAVVEPTPVVEAQEEEEQQQQQQQQQPQQQQQQQQQQSPARQRKMSPARAASPPHVDMDPMDAALLRTTAQDDSEAPPPLASPPKPVAVAAASSSPAARVPVRAPPAATDLNSSSFFGPGLLGPDEADDEDSATPVPKKPAAAKKKPAKASTKVAAKSASPDENAVAVRGGANKGGKKLYNPNKARKNEFRDSIVITPATAVHGKTASRVVTNKLDAIGGVSYGDILGDVLKNGLFAVQTPAK